MLNRKYMDNLITWKNTTNKKALVISGARQVGKTFLVEAFAEKYYDSFIEINFIENPNLISLFDGVLSTENILAGISLYLPGKKIISGKTLLFLDEIQECPNAITALKFLSKSEEIDVIASGSALGMAYNRATSFPVGSVEYVDMTSLYFREFLWALGIGDETINTIKEYFDETK